MSATRARGARRVGGSGSRPAAMATAVRVTTVATLSVCRSPWGASGRHGQGKGGRHRDGCRLRLPGISTRRYSPPAMARKKATRSPHGGCRGAVRDVRDHDDQAREREHEPEEPQQLLDVERATATSPRASIDGPSLTGPGPHRAAARRPWQSDWARVIVVVPTLRQPATVLRSGVRTGHGSRDRPRRRAATTTGSNCVPTRDARSRRAHPGSAAPPGRRCSWSATRTHRPRPRSGQRAGCASPARPAG